MSRTVFSRATCLALALVMLAAGCGLRGRSIPAILPTNSGAKTVIYAGDNATVLTELRGDERRESVSLSDIPLILQNAVIAIEDNRFWDHNGVDVRAVVRAARSNTESDDISQGGSTITQQYIKNTILSPEQTLQRKIEEASLAIQLEKVYSKEFILEQYLNTIFFGNRSYGVQVASKGYFGKPIQEVNIAEAALLAGIIQSPSRHNPYDHPETSKARRNLVLDEMLEQGYITKFEHELAQATPIQLVGEGSDAVTERYPAPHFVEEVKRFIRTDTRFGSTEAERENLLLNGGLKIYTTIDLDMQAKAEDAINSRFPNAGRSNPDAALVAIESATGYVKAMVGGYDYFDEDTDNHPYAQVNLAMGTGRQSGSTFKAIAMAAALENGVDIDDRFPAPSRATITRAGHAPWPVKGHALGSRAALDECMVHSSNTCFGYLIADDRVTPERVTEYAGLMGIDVGPGSGFKTVLSSVLGTNNSTVLEMASAYTTFPNRGVYIPPAMVTKVVRADGTVLFQRQHTQTKVLEPETADAITLMMEQVLVRGTAAGKGLDRPAAGKTGTTQGSTDAWFVGYTPELTTAVWAGYSEPVEGGGLRSVGGDGGRIAAPVWQSFMLAAHKDLPKTPWTFTATPPTSTTTVPPGNDELLEQLAPVEMVGMPDLSSMSYNDAAQIIRSSGLTLRRIDVNNPEIPNGQVVGQAPAPGSSVAAGSTVYVEATPGNPPPPGPVPNIVGRNVNDIAEWLRGQGWTINVQLVPGPTPTVPPNAEPDTAPVPLAPGFIWDQSPVGGSPVGNGSITVQVQP